MDSASQWVSRMRRLFFADEYTRHTEGTPSASQTPNMESAFQAVQNALPKLENRVIEFLQNGLWHCWHQQDMSLKPDRHTSLSCCLRNTGSENYTWVSRWLHPLTAPSLTYESLTDKSDASHRTSSPKTSMLHGMSNTLSYSSLHGWSPPCTTAFAEKVSKARIPEAWQGSNPFVPPGSKTQQPPGDLHQVQDKGPPNPCMAFVSWLKRKHWSPVTSPSSQQWQNWPNEDYSLQKHGNAIDRESALRLQLTYQCWVL